MKYEGGRIASSSVHGKYLQQNSVRAKLPVNPVRGGVWPRGVLFTKEQKWWGSIGSSDILKNPHSGVKYQIKDKLCTYLK